MPLAKLDFWNKITHLIGDTNGLKRKERSNMSYMKYIKVVLSIPRFNIKQGTVTVYEGYTASHPLVM